MLAVWSFWTKPFYAHHYRMWASEKHHRLAWVLSVETARRHFDKTALVTDDAGAALIVDQLGLRFDAVSTELNCLDDEDSLWWSLGKLYAYRAQTEPFVHIDNDCFLWNPLPERMLQADVLAQSPERFSWSGGTYYRPDVLEPLVESEGGWLPDALAWYLSVRGNGAVNCGVFGGNRLELIRDYADQAIQLVEHPNNQSVWRQCGDRISENLIAEQYLLMACIEHAKWQRKWPTCNVQYLFESTDQAFLPGPAARAGFTHMIGLAKADPVLAQRLNQRVRRDYPDYYARCAVEEH